MRALVLAALLAAAPAGAEPFVEELALTSAGPVVLTTPDDGPQTVSVGGAGVAMPGEPWRTFLVHQEGDSLLFLLGDPAAGPCRTLFVWVEAAAGAVTTSPMFGTCADVEEIGPAPGGGLRVVMPGGAPGAGWVAFDWDGARLSETDLGFRPSGQAPGDGPEFWLDRYPYDLATAADWQDRLSALLDEAALGALWTNISLCSPFAAEADWIVGAGCEQYDCDANAAMIALHATDGRLVVALRRNGQTALFGDGRGLPAGVEAFLAGG